MGRVAGEPEIVGVHQLSVTAEPAWNPSSFWSLVLIYLPPSLRLPLKLTYGCWVETITR